jgi:hypothetical protein
MNSKGEKAEFGVLFFIFLLIGRTR